MKAKKKMLLALGVLLVLLGAAAVFLLKDQKETEQTEENNERTEAVLISMDPASVQEVQIEGDREPIHIVREGDALLLKDLEEYPQSQTQMEALLNGLADVTGLVVQEKEFEADRYGFGASALTVNLKGEEEITLHLGDYNESTSSWYVMKDGDSALYTIPRGKGELMHSAPWAYLDASFIPEFEKGQNMVERLYHIVIERPDLEEALEIRSIDGEAEGYTSSYEFVSPVHIRTSLKTMNGEIGSLFGFAARTAIGRYTEADAAKYGFDEPAMVMTVGHDGRDDVFTIGKTNPAGYYYMIWNGSDLLYLIQREKLSFLTVKADDLFFAIALLPEIDSIESVELTLNGDAYNFALQREADGKIEKVLLGNEEVDQKLFRQFYSFLLELDVQELHTAEEEGEERLSISYRYLNGNVDTITEIQLQDGRNAGILLNGEMSFLGRIAYVDKVETELGHLLAGEKIDTNW